MLLPTRSCSWLLLVSASCPLPTPGCSCRFPGCSCLFPGCTLLFLAVPGCSWLLLPTPACPWLLLARPCLASASRLPHPWLLVAAPGHSCPLLAAPGCSRLFLLRPCFAPALPLTRSRLPLAAANCSWPLLPTPAHSWWRFPEQAYAQLELIMLCSWNDFARSRRTHSWAHLITGNPETNFRAPGVLHLCVCVCAVNRLMGGIEWSSLPVSRFGIVAGRTVDAGTSQGQISSR
jgi:hypothetical protein